MTQCQIWHCRRTDQRTRTHSTLSQHTPHMLQLAGTCGGFFAYYYRTGGLSCDCNVPIGEYEWVFQNLQPSFATQVGQDYGGSFDNIAGHGAWVRQKACAGCVCFLLSFLHCSSLGVVCLTESLV